MGESRPVSPKSLGKATPKPPRSLSSEAKKLWIRIFEACDWDEPGLLLLTTMCESFDRMRQAQALIAKVGLVIAEKTAAGEKRYKRIRRAQRREIPARR